MSETQTDHLRALESHPLLVTGYRPEVAVQIISMLAEYFTKEWGSDVEFRRHLVDEVQRFLMQLDHPLNDMVCAWDGETLVGAAAIDAVNQKGRTARIRWFIVDEQYRGQGYGRFLFERAIDLCRTRGHDHVVIATLKDHDPAVTLYKQLGFTLFDEIDLSTGSSQIVQQWYERSL